MPFKSGQPNAERFHSCLIYAVALPAAYRWGQGHGTHRPDSMTMSVGRVLAAEEHEASRWEVAPRVGVGSGPQGLGPEASHFSLSGTQGGFTKLELISCRAVFGLSQLFVSSQRSGLRDLFPKYT